MSTLALTAAHTKASILETVRTPIAIISSIAFPTLMLIAFVLPQAEARDNPTAATVALAQVCVFSVFSTGLYSVAFGIAEKRDKAWNTFVRTLPAGPIPRIGSELISIGLLGFAALVPVLLLGGLLTAANAPFLRVLFGLGALVAACLFFMLIGTTIGYGLHMKAVAAVTSVSMFVLAFLGGLFVPAELMSPTMEMISRFTPTRGGRELVIWAVKGGTLPAWVIVNLLVWTVILGTATLVLFKRDQGRRFR